MQVRRVLKTLLAKWMVIVLVAVIGGAVGWVLASNHNDGIRPRWRAQAPVTFFQIEEEEDSTSGSSNNRAGGTTSSAAADVETERARAGLLLEETLEANPRLSIQINTDDNTLLFVAIGRDGEETLAEALALRDEYQALGATVLSVDQIEATMATVLVDIDRLKEEIAVLEVTEPEPEEPAVVAQRTALETEIARLDLRQAEISIWILNPELRPTESEFLGTDPDEARADTTETTEPPPIVTLEALQEEQSQNATILFRLRGELDRIPNPPVAEALEINSALKLEALQLDVEELEAQYIGLLRRLDRRTQGGFIEEPIISDETQSPRSAGLSTMGGLLVGIFLASLAVMGYDQIRQPVWAASDLDGVATLGFVNRKRETDVNEIVWYPTALTQRRRDIQTLRAVTDGVTDETSAVIGFFGVGVAGEEVGELAADLAASYTVADRDVLLIDGNSFHPNTLPEFGTGINRLNDVLMTPWPADMAVERINEFLDNAVPSAPGLTAVYVDAEAHDPIDVLASPNCRTLMEVVAQRYDMIVVAGPDITDPLADTVIHRVDLVTLVGYVGYTEKVRIETAAAALTDRKATVAGVALLEGRRQPVREQLTQYLRGSRDDEYVADTDEVAATDEEIAVTLPKSAPIPTGSGKNSKAATAQGDSGETAEEPARKTPTVAESVLAKARAKRAESKSGNH